MTSHLDSLKQFIFSKPHLRLAKFRTGSTPGEAQGDIRNAGQVNTRDLEILNPD